MKLIVSSTVMQAVIVICLTGLSPASITLSAADLRHSSMAISFWPISDLAYSRALPRRYGTQLKLLFSMWIL
jgi:hypothetical protein